MKSARLKLAFTLLALGMAALPAVAATVSASFSVSVTVVSGCQVTAPTMVDASTRARATASSVSVACTYPTAFNVSLATEPAMGTTAKSATGTAGKASGSASNVPGDGLLPRLAQSVNWTPSTVGSGMTGRSGMNGAGRGFFEAHTAYGESSRAQSPASGQRASLIVVTVTY